MRKALSSKIKGIGKGTFAKGKTNPPPSELEWDSGTGWHRLPQNTKASAGGKSRAGGKSNKAKSSVGGKSRAGGTNKNSFRVSNMDLGTIPEQVNAVSGNEQPPPTLPQIWMSAPQGIQSQGRTIWWEAVSFTQSGRQPVPNHRLEGKLLIPRLNMQLIRKGLRAEQLSLYREENKGPAVLLSVSRFTFQNNILKRSIIQVKGPVRMGPVYPVDRS